jgi:hypothetical protein
MNDAVFDLVIEDWWIQLYIVNVIELYVAAWLPFAIVAATVLVRYIKHKRSEVKISPLLGVLQPTQKPGKHRRS